MRLILYLGKGGVGKTTTAAATAARAAELGHRTLVVSTDVAHSLADALDHPLGALPTQLTDKLWARRSTCSTRCASTGASCAPTWPGC